MTPPLLYHYTTQLGMLGILESRKLWASDIRYLNDSSEVQHGLATARSLLSEMLRDDATAAATTLHTAVSEYLDQAGVTASLSGSYVLSFSEERDLLSQWRAYGGEAGFALGFEVAVSDDMTGRPELRLRRCEYEADVLEGTLRKTLVHILTGMEEAVDEPTEQFLRTIARNLAAAIVGMAATHKHPKFDEEREWRVVVEEALINQVGLRVQLRPGSTVPIPYVAIPFQGAGLSLSLREIVVGPTTEPELARGAVEDHLAWSDQADDSEISVRTSDIPFRPM